MKNRNTMLAVSAILAAIIAGGGALVGILTSLDPNAGLSDIGIITWLVIVITAVVAAAKDLKTYVAKAPES